MTIDSLREQLQAVVDFKRTGGMKMPHRFLGNEDLVLQWGTVFERSTARPPGTRIPMGCYARSYSVATRSKGRWIYCEGYAIQPDLGLALPHAWVTPADHPTEAHDLAWGGDALYLGVPFQEAYVRKMWNAPKSRELKSFAVLDCWWLRWPLLTGKVRIEDVIWRPISPHLFDNVM